MSHPTSEDAYRKISALIENQFPEFIRSEGPLFIAFLKSFYEYMEQEGEALERGRAILDIIDVDKTMDEFVDYFRTEFMATIPITVLADKRLLTKYIREFYRTRGSEESYRFLFRSIFGEEITLYYPGDDVLRASDGRWTKESIIYVSQPYTSSDLTAFIGKLITGGTSGATGRVQNVLSVRLRGIPADQFVLENVTGSFIGGERITDLDGTFATILASSGTLTSIVVTEGGAFWEPDDTLTISGTASGASATGTVISVNNDASGQGIVFRIVDGGRGYTIGNTVISFIGGSGTGAGFSITSIANTELISTLTDIIDDVKFVTLNTSTFPSLGANTRTLSAELAAADINDTITASLHTTNMTVGTINAISLTSVGEGYSVLPVVSVVEPSISSQAIADDWGGGIKGDDAVVVANNATGALLTIQLVTSSGGFVDDEVVNIVGAGSTVTINTIEVRDNSTVGFSRSAQANAFAVASVSGTLSLPGRYTDTRGLVSSQMRIQDNYYYQDFSYDIHSDIGFDLYKNIILGAIHPAGTKLFGTVVLNGFADERSRFDVTSYDIVTYPDNFLGNKGELEISVSAPTITVS